MTITMTEQEWLNGFEGGTPLSADRLNYIEDRISTVAGARGMDIVVGLGQSNQSGRGVVDLSRMDLGDVRYYQFGSSQPSGVTTTILDRVSVAVEPLSNRDGNIGLGPVNAWVRQHLGTIPTARSVLVVPCAFGSTALVDDTSQGWRPTIAGNLFDRAMISALAAKAAADEVPGTINRFVAALWVQGENDSFGSSDVSATYQTYLDQLIDACRTRLGVADLPFVIGQMVPDYLTNGAFKQQINAVHIDTPRRKTRTAFAYGPVGAQFDAGDLSHYAAPGYRNLGQSQYAGYERALTNVNDTDPVTPAAPTLTQSGTTIAARWPQARGRVADYHLRYRSNGGAWTALTRSLSIDVNATITGLELGAAIGVQVSTQNAEGVSAWSTETVLVMQKTPNPVTGLTAGTPTFTSIPLTWTAPATNPSHDAATSYLVEFKRSADSTWLTSGTVTTTSATVAGLIDNTSYDVRVTAVNAAGSSAPATLAPAATTPTLPAPLDAPASAPTQFGAYGLRRMRAAYGGSAIRVVRVSDSAEQDIGFSGSNLNTSALNTFAAGGTVRVKTWYDQSTAGVNFTQATVANMPLIVNAGTLVTMPNGNPGVQFDGTASHLTRASGLYAAGAASMCIVQRGSTANGVLVAEKRVAAVQPNYVLLGQASSGLVTSANITNDAATALLATSTGGSAYSLTVAHQVSVRDSGSSFDRWVDGAAVTPTVGPAYTRSGTMTLDTLALGASARGTVTNFWGGIIAEVILYGSALTTADRQALEASQKSYYATP